MIVEHPVYRVSWGSKPGVIEGKAGVLGFYNSVGEAVLWHSDDRLAVADWGVCDEITFHQLAEGAILRQLGLLRSITRPPVSRLQPPGLHLALRRPARLAGEHLYEDKTSLKIEEVDRRDAITPARVREIHRELLAELEARLGPDFWVLRLENSAATVREAGSGGWHGQARAASGWGGQRWSGAAGCSCSAARGPGKLMNLGYVTLTPPPSTPIPAAAVPPARDRRRWAHLRRPYPAPAPVRPQCRPSIIRAMCRWTPPPRI